MDRNDKFMTNSLSEFPVIVINLKVKNKSNNKQQISLIITSAQYFCKFITAVCRNISPLSDQYYQKHWVTA